MPALVFPLVFPVGVLLCSGVSEVDRMMRLALTLRLVLAIALLISLGGCASYIGSRIIAAPNQSGDSLSFDDEAWEAQIEPQLFSQRLEIKSPHDGSQLISHRLPAGDYPHRYERKHVSSRQVRLEVSVSVPVGPHQPARGTVLFVHGWQGDYRQHLFHALALAGDGWDGVLTDLRGHGRSGGDRISFGVHEAVELRELIDDLVELPDFPPPLVLMGSSMGASVALMAAAGDSPVAGVVAIAPYADFISVFPDGLQRMAPRGTRIFLTPRRVERALAHAQEQGRADLSQAAPLALADQIDVPVLLIHGERDRFVPSEQSKLLMGSLPQAEMKLLEDQGHMSLIMDRDAVLESAAPWFEYHFSAQGPR